MVYCYCCGQMLASVKEEHIRLNLCPEHMKQLKEFLSTLEPIHCLRPTITKEEEK